MIYTRISLCVALMALITTPTWAADAEIGSDRLLGDLGGMRPRLADHGVDLTIEYKGDLFYVSRGGLKTGSNYLDNLDLKLDIDGEKAFGISGNKVAIYFLNNFGGKPNGTRIGSIDGIDNIETSTNSFKLYEAWIEQSFWRDRASILLGLHDLNSEFYVTDNAANFLKPTMQLGTGIAISGQNGPSVFPTTSLAARLKIQPVQDIYVMGAIFDGLPGDANRPRGTHIRLGHDDGALLIGEAGWTPGGEDSNNKLAVGAWTYTEKQDDLVDVDSLGNPVRRTNQGAYILASYQFFKGANTDPRAASVFVHSGIADGDTKPVNWDWQTGMALTGFVPGREEGEIGIGATGSRNSDKFVDNTLFFPSGANADRYEYGLEAYYRDQIYRGVSLQPDVQYIINPGTDPGVKNALILGARLDINF